MQSVFAIDLGKTNCRFAVWPVGAEIDVEPAVSLIGTGAPGLAESGSIDAVMAAIIDVSGRIDYPAYREPTLVGVGVAGATAAPAAAEELGNRLRRLWPAADIVVASDGVTSHAGALAGGPGVVLAAGTGVVTLAIGDDGEVVLVDGWGPWLGDDGGGAFIGRAGLRAALMDVDGRGDKTALIAAAAAMYRTDMQNLPSVIGGDAHPVRALAAFAPEVARIAASGDPVARRVIDSAVDALVCSVRTAVRRLGRDHPVDVAMTGGLLSIGDVLTEPLSARVRTECGRVDLVAAQGSSLDGARLIAQKHDTVHEPALMRTTGVPR